MASIQTDLTKMLGIRHPIMLAGMGTAAGSELAAAVSNAGGIGVIGGIGYTPAMLRKKMQEIKADLVDKKAAFGVDLLIPAVGGNARATNYDYTKGQLPQLIDVIIEEGAKLFVCAVGVPPKWAVDKLHAHGILVMNMIGAPKHVPKALEVGVDIICAQGGEGGGHTGDIATAILVPKVVDMCKGRISPLTGKQVPVVAAGGIYDGRSVAMALCFGAQAVWVGTRFVCATEAGASRAHQEAVVTADYIDTCRTLIFSGRPMRVRKTAYVADWENNRQAEIKELTNKGIVPAVQDMDTHDYEDEELLARQAFLMGQVAGSIGDIKPAKEIVEEMVNGAIETLRSRANLVVVSSGASQSARL
ncbi:nitronate monooxygenase [Synchytrium microbalum]|uniref:Nitronate monooxygenase n=1 Tax=Synchytrium microbalum TaxID=1806994 RepID=A0A507CDC7_9FUNG|nr:nitronate monooxygenase [Synchytrium microbalum]TPX37501.1 nitronate monooxygenase [Synchytrium microbalum]